MTTATILAVALSLGTPSSRATAPPPSPSGSQGEPSPSSGPKEGLRGTLSLGPGASGRVEIVDATGELVSSVFLRPNEQVRVDLSIGEYTLRDGSGMPLGPVTIVPNVETTVVLPARMRAPASEPAIVEPVAGDPRMLPSGVDEPADDDDRADERPSQRTYKRWLSPMLSALVPGVGQMVNREVGKGVGILLSSVALLGGSIAMTRWGDPTEGAGGADDDTRPNALEVTRLAAHAAFTGVLTLLYPSQIMDAHRVAVGKLVTPRTDHRITLEVARMTTIGRRAGQPAYDLFHDWTLTVMGQPMRRLSVGVSDVGLKVRGGGGRTTFQGGVRVTYRFFDRRRFWIAAGIGSFAQATVAAGRPVHLSSDDPPPDAETDFGGGVYAQMEFRLFMLDRWWIGAIPRFGVPLSTRYYSGRRSLPPYAPTFELGTSAGVLF